MATVAYGMARRGHAVAFTYDPRGPVGDRLDAIVERVPVRIRNDADPTALLRLRRLIFRSRADVVVVNTARELRVGGFAARLARRAAVVNRRGAGDVLREAPLDRWLQHALIDVLVRDSRWGVQAIGARNPWFRRPVFQARNGIDGAAVARTAPMERATFGAGREEFVIVVSDRAGRPAGAPDVAAAGRRVVEAMPGADIHIVVIGAVEPATVDRTMRTVAGAKGVRASFLGPRPPGEALSIMAAADIFARPSSSDGIPYAALEAMALGLPIVATATAG